MAVHGRGILVVFEGIDGAGKTTQARALAKNLRAEGSEVIESKEPTNGQWGALLRASSQTGRLDPHAELELFVKDRREHVRDLIEPGLDRGAVVIVDRYYFSTAAYQGARGMDWQDILALNQEFAPAPDLLFILRVTPSVGRQRIAARGDEANLFEGAEALAASAAIFEQIRGDFVRHLDGNRAVSELEYSTLEAVHDVLDQRARPVRDSGSNAAVTRADLIGIATRVEHDNSVAPEDKAAAVLAGLRSRSASS